MPAEYMCISTTTYGHFTGPPYCISVDHWVPARIYWALAF